MKYLFIVIMIGFIGLVGGAKLHPTLNPSGKIGGEFDPIYVINKIQSYSTGETQEGYSMGRYGSTKRVIKVLSTEGILSSMLLGKGPGTFIKTGLMKNNYDDEFEKKFGIVYGRTGFVWMFSQVGLLGVLCYLAFLWKLFKEVLNIYRSKLDTYWQIFTVGAIGALFIIMFDFAAYSTNCVAGKVLTSVIYYVIAVLLTVSSREKKHISDFSGYPYLLKT